jgi:hypothetical protein
MRPSNGRMDKSCAWLTQRPRATLQLQLVDAPHLGGLATSTRLPGKRQDSGASQDTFYKMTLQFERSTRLKARGLRAMCPSVFFSGFFGIFLPKLQMDPQPEPTTQPKARGLLHMECDFAIALPYQLRLQDNAGVFEDLRGQHSRTLGTTREDFKIAQTLAAVHSSLGMLRLL